MQHWKDGQDKAYLTKTNFRWDWNTYVFLFFSPVQMGIICSENICCNTGLWLFAEVRNIMIRTWKNSNTLYNIIALHKALKAPLSSLPQAHRIEYTQKFITELIHSYPIQKLNINSSRCIKLKWTKKFKCFLRSDHQNINYLITFRFSHRVKICTMLNNDIHEYGLLFEQCIYMIVWILTSVHGKQKLDFLTCFFKLYQREVRVGWIFSVCYFSNLSRDKA